MAMNYNVLGLIFASVNDDSVSALTQTRTMGSIPFGGRYRLIDFPLSNMVNSGVQEVGVLTKSNYGSLMDHLGSGREWDLARKKGGLHLLPPFSQNGGGSGDGSYQGRLQALNRVWSFIEHSKAEYAIFANCDVIANIDFTPVIEQHIETEADITAVYAKCEYTREKNSKCNVMVIDEEKNVKEVLKAPEMSGVCNIGLDMFVMRMDFLKHLLREADSKNEQSFVRDILQKHKGEFKVMGYEYTNHFAKIESLASYFDASMSLLNLDVYKDYFNSEAPISTKIGDSAPVKYGLECKVKNSTVADGCVIEGTVENCILFRGVKIGKGAVVKNSILMQGTVIGENCDVNGIISDKSVEVGAGVTLYGTPEFPTVYAKNSKLA